MGLDIAAYSKVQLSDESEVSLYWDSQIPCRELQLDLKEGEEGEEVNFIVFEDCFRMRAGSYGGYNRWREELAVFAGYESANSTWDDFYGKGAFYELICFSDCEGYFGSSVCEKLLRDFEEHYEKVHQEKDEYFVSKYEEWMDALSVAANDGVLVFQ